MTPVLEVSELSAGYGGLPVLRDLSFRLDAGEVLALIGANGAGKTTALLTISGLLRPLTGVVTFEGVPVVGVRPDRLARSGLVHVPDDRGLFPSLTVAEHLDVVRADRAARARVDEWFPALAPLTDRRVGLLSGGEQQMVALAQALVRAPRVLMIDEMSLGLAPMVASSLLPVIRRVADESGCAVLLVEQHAAMALSIADQAVVLAHGSVVAQDSAGSLEANFTRVLDGYLGGPADGETSARTSVEDESEDDAGGNPPPEPSSTEPN